MHEKDIHSIAIEGGDQTGKATATDMLVKELSKDYQVERMSYPVYASPFGATIRKILWGEEEVTSNLPKEPNRALMVKASLYALDRLQTLDYLLADPNLDKKILIFDRSPFSNAISIAYALNQIGEEESVRLVKQCFDLEDFMISSLHLRNCVIQTVVSSWGNARNASHDIYENDAVQAATLKIYSQMKNIVGEGWFEIMTKNSEGWRSHEEILEDMLNIMNTRLSLQPSESGECGLRDVNIHEILPMYGVCIDKDLLGAYYEAFFSNAKEDMHQRGIEIANCIVRLSNGISFRNKDVKEAFEKIVKQYPETLDIVDSAFPDSGFKEKMLKSLYGIKKES